VVGKPVREGGAEVCKGQRRGKAVYNEGGLETRAKRAPGLTGADNENVMNGAALVTARRRKTKIGMDELGEAIDRVVAGPEKKSRIISEREKKVIAYHEAAHALVARMLRHTDPVHKVSIIPRGGALGYVLQLPIEDRYLVMRAEILDRVTVALAGRAAEEMVFNEVSTGASDDLEKATKMVRRMIMEFGMSEELGPLTFGNKQDHVFLGRDIARDRNYSEEVAAAIDKEVRSIVTSCFERAKKLLKENENKLKIIADTLIEKETIEGPDLERLLNNVDGAKAPAVVGEAAAPAM